MNKFIRGTLILIAAAFLSECVEFLVNMKLASELKEEGMGLYMSVMPVLFLILILASLELPISVSKYIAEHKQETHLSLLKHALKLGVLSTVLFSLLTAAAVSIPSTFSKFPAHIHWLLFALIPIAAFSAVARGYFMGIQQMSKIAVSNLLRKCAQFLLLYFIFNLFDYPLEISLLVALGALVASELLVLLYLFSMFVVHLKGLKAVRYYELSGKQARAKLLSVSLPTVGLRIFQAFVNAVQPFLIQMTLIRAGFTAVTATEHFGMLMGVAMSIGFFPAFIAHSLMVALIPNVSDAYARLERDRLSNLLHQSMWLTLLYGTVSVFIMHLFAEELSAMFFSSPVAAHYLKQLWPFFLFHFFMIPLQAYLIGVGLIKDAFLHSIWANAFAFGAVFVLGSMPSLHMDGVILGMNFGAVLQALLHYFTVCKRIGVRVWFVPRSGEL
ncbi:multidrug transporter MatE [Neobacillus notoginsengisoli]|uniref:Multidrug transporter MatE n=1 Tax=Neobacillus notoginsengisoli TaxID=1578198 RepID=A0A417YS64_9BACI|nr:oligosaccharide flippase family protein [Neobacillus notoginsengisoli]RHW38130.1 multidrug transporter MatE [Neobacillus notoginsengisoli]